MCIVIDTNRIPSVLNPNASDHNEFRPILSWIDTHNTRIVYGGTKYKTELLKMPKYYGILVEMRKAGQAYEAKGESIDEVQKQIESKTKHTNFNDQAIVAIVIVSRCRLVCSSDKNSFGFIKEPSLYPRGCKPPIIYTGSRNKDRLYHRHILGKCGPCCL